jgi:hypothetical protein
MRMSQVGTLKRDARKSGKTDTYVYGACALAAAILFSMIYIRYVHPTPEGDIVNAAIFQVPWPFRLRFLLPVTIMHYISRSYAETEIFKTILCSVFVFGLFLMLPTYAARLGINHFNRLNGLLAFLCVLFAHYYFSNFYDVYYVYDIPGIFFYMVVFLCLTDQRPLPFLIGLPLLVMFSYSRETIVIAVLHAMGYVYFANRDRLLKEKKTRIGLMCVGLICVGLGRLSIIHLLGGDISNQVASYDRGMHAFRLISNTEILFLRPIYFEQLALIGCGIIVWLPFVYRHLSLTLKHMIICSVPALAALLWAGNYLEIRIYNELVPLMAILLYEMDRLAKEKRASTRPWSSNKVA